MKKIAAFCILTVLASTAHARVMTPREMLFEPETKDQFAALTKEERVESLGKMFELTNRTKGLTVRQINKQAHAVEECVMRVIGEPRYAQKDVMTPISDCAVLLGFESGGE